MRAGGQSWNWLRGSVLGAHAPAVYALPPQTTKANGLRGLRGLQGPLCVPCALAPPPPLLQFPDMFAEFVGVLEDVVLEPEHVLRELTAPSASSDEKRRAFSSKSAKGHATMREIKAFQR